MACFGKQRETVGANSGENEQDDVCKGESQGQTQHSCCERRMSVRVPGVGVHKWSLRRCASGIKTG